MMMDSPSAPPIEDAYPGSTWSAIAALPDWPRATTAYPDLFAHDNDNDNEQRRTALNTTATTITSMGNGLTTTTTLNCNNQSSSRNLTSAVASHKSAPTTFASNDTKYLRKKRNEQAAAVAGHARRACRAIEFQFGDDELESREHLERMRREREEHDAELRYAESISRGGAAGLAQRVAAVAVGAVHGGRAIIQRVLEKISTDDVAQNFDEISMPPNNNNNINNNNNNIEKTLSSSASSSATWTTTPLANAKQALQSNGIVHKLDSKPLLSLGGDLGCSSLHDALQARVHLRHLRKCGTQVSGAAFLEESLTVDDLQKYKLTLSDVVRGLGVDFASLTKMGLTVDKMTRKNRWFDVNVLSTDFVAHAGGDVVHDLGFDTDTIFRLQCADFEIAQLGLDFTSLISKCGFTRKHLIRVPWYPQTMVDLLGLSRKHLVDDLRLRPKDFSVLRQRRAGWTLDFFKEKLEFSDADLVQCVGFHRAELAPPVTNVESSARELIARQRAAQQRDRTDNDDDDESGSEQYEEDENAIVWNLSANERQLPPNHQGNISAWSNTLNADDDDSDDNGDEIGTISAPLACPPDHCDDDDDDDDDDDNASKRKGVDTVVFATCEKDNAVIKGLFIDERLHRVLSAHAPLQTNDNDAESHGSESRSDRTNEGDECAENENETYELRFV